MINKKSLKIIIPLVAMVVLVESVVLVNSLEKQRKGGGDNGGAIERRVDVAKLTGGEKSEKLTMKMEPENRDIKTGQTSFIDVILETTEKKSLDAVSVYVEIDPEMVALERVEVNNNLPKPIVAKVSKNGNVALVNYLISAPSGYQVEVGTRVALARIYFTPLKSGQTDFKILGEGESEAETMLVETGTSQVIPFTGHDLSVSILK